MVDQKLAFPGSLTLRIRSAVSGLIAACRERARPTVRLETLVLLVVAYMIATNEIESRHRVDLDTTIKTLADTGRDMGLKYKETSEGGIAANLVLC